jgi:thioredoxin reductase
VFAFMANELAIAAGRRQDHGMEKLWDCIVVGAGAAGLSAALVLGRARQRTLVVDAGGQSNRDAYDIGGLLGHDRRPPAAFCAAGRDELAAYPTVELRSGEVLGGERHEAGFVLELGDGAREAARRVLLATGMDYRFPALPGIAERWGRSVFHCPFCHGWEVRDQPLGVLDRGAPDVQRALLLRVWSDDVTLLADGPAELDAEDVERLRAAGVTVDERRVAELRGPDSALTAVAFADGGERPCGGLLVPVTLHQRSALAEQLGAAASGPGPVAVDAIEVDPMFHTSVPGLSAAGDVSSQVPSVANAVAADSSAAAMIVHGLMSEAHGLTAS